MKLSARASSLHAATLLWACFSFLPTARAHVERFALVVGNNAGLGHEAPLRYAESDAQRVHDTLREIGGFLPSNIALVTGESAEVMRRTLIDFNDRVRSRRSQPNTQVVLLVYYSGHADTEDLHLGSSRFAIAELSQLVRGSAADFRLLVLDACRSGVLTRGKGGRQTKPFDIPEGPELSGEGLAFLTASAENELAQESDELRGSFFTHAFVAGLLGAADRDRDGNVLLDEAYQYAYDNTLRASSRSARGLQHPTFFYDLRGQGQLVLARPFAPGSRRGVLELPRAATYLVFQGSEQGPVLAEVAADDPVRRLSVAPGPYFVRGRTAAHVVEGTVEVAANAVTRVDGGKLTRIEYAHLLRKGGASRRRVHGLEALAHVRTRLPNAETLCAGALAGYRLDLPRASLSLRAGYCTSTMQHATLTSRTDEVSFGARAVHVWDLSHRLSLDAGAGLGYSYFSQRFETRGRAPSRRASAPLAELVLALNVELARGLYATLDAALQGYLLAMEDDSGDSDLRASGAGRIGAGAGARF